jgi:HMG (high mobility group) box
MRLTWNLCYPNKEKQNFVLNRKQEKDLLLRALPVNLRRRRPKHRYVVASSLKNNTNTDHYFTCSQPESIKSKEVAAASTGDSSDENDEDEDSDDEPKSAIQKPISSLQLFCDQNLAKYKKQNPKMTQQELKRLMAKEFSSLSEKKKKVYATMAEKAKAEINKPSPKPKAVAKPKATSASPKMTLAKISSPSGAKENSKPATVGKHSKVTTEAPTKSPQKPASKATAKVTPDRTKNSDSSAAKASALTPKQILYKNEPSKPPEYGFCVY